MQRARQWVSRTILASTALGLIGGTAWLLLRPAEVTVVEIRVRDIRPAIQGIGTVEAKVVVQLAAKFPSRIVSIGADQGDLVRKGQPLVQLDAAQIQAEMESATAGLERANLAVMAQEAAVLRAEAQLPGADAALARARANRTLAQANVGRWRTLAASGVVPVMEVEARATTAEVADQDVKSAAAQREATVKEIAAQQAALKVAQSEIAAATAALAAVRAREADTIIVSPIDGFVVTRDLEPGAAVGAGTPILKVADPRTAWVTVFVDERESGPLFVGGAAEVHFRSLPGKTFRGKVARIRRESDRVTEQRVFDLTLNEPPPHWTLGEQVEATIRAAAKRVTALPLGAVVRTPDGTGAWTVVEGRLRFREARFGVVDPEGWIEVLDGLSAGEHVVLAPGAMAARENEGRRVRDVAQSLQADVIAP